VASPKTEGTKTTDTEWYPLTQSGVTVQYKTDAASRNKDGGYLLAVEVQGAVRDHYTDCH
jgi:hypothetical protein